EAPPGIRKNLQRTYQTWTEEYLSAGSVLRAQSLFVLAWFHSIIQERRIYIPQGWSKFYDFSFADLRSSADIINALVSESDNIEWSTVHGLLENAIYGGRVDNDYDMRVLRAYLSYYFSNEVLSKQPLRNVATGITMPHSTKHKDYMEIINQLP